MPPNAGLQKRDNCPTLFAGVSVDQTRIARATHRGANHSAIHESYDYTHWKTCKTKLLPITRMHFLVSIQLQGPRETLSRVKLHSAQ
jgi:hypothetical protein